MPKHLVSPIQPHGRVERDLMDDDDGGGNDVHVVEVSELGTYGVVVVRETACADRRVAPWVNTLVLYTKTAAERRPVNIPT